MARKRTVTADRLGAWWEGAAAELGVSSPKSTATITLADFVRGSWEVLEPTTQLDWNWHVDAICLHVQETLFDWLKHKQDPSYEQRIRNLLINVPPGSLKSRIVSVCTPAWFWLYEPSWRAIFLSANPRVALRDSVFCRDLLESEWYQQTFKPWWKLRLDNNAKSSFWNSAGGFRNAGGVDSRITGDRGDCLAGSTLVHTEHGLMSIKDIHYAKSKPRVWSFNHQSEKPELRSVVASRRINEASVNRIITADGREIIATDDHRMYNGIDYASAKKISRSRLCLHVWEAQNPRKQAVREMLLGERAVSDFALLSLWHQGCQKAIRSQQVDKSWGISRVLFKILSVQDLEPRIKGAAETLCHVWQANEKAPRSQILQQRLHPISEKNIPPVRMVRGRVSTASTRSKVLLCKLQEHSSFRADERQEQLQLSRGEGIPKSFLRDQGFDCLERPESVPYVRGWRGGDACDRKREEAEFVGSPYRREHPQQRPTESGNAMYRLPQHGTQGGLRPVSISSIDGCGEMPVYDIQVEGNHNFFANGILVHNCLFVDDPHDADEVKSEVKREHVKERWDNAISNRVNDLRSSVRIGIMQRLDELDWGAHVKGQGWSVLCIRQEFELGLEPTPLGWDDPRKSPGELMMPGRFTAEILDSEKRRLGASGYAAQHQQNPSPSGGGLFKVRNWRLAISLPPIMRTILSVDAAFKGTKTSDYVVIGAIAQTEPVRTTAKLGPVGSDGKPSIQRIPEYQYWIPELWRGKAGITETETQLQVMIGKYPQAHTKLIEDKANGSAIIERMSGVFSGIEPYQPGSNSKESRASAMSPVQERGDILLPCNEQVRTYLKGRGMTSITVGEWWDLHPPEHESNAEHVPAPQWVKAFIDELAAFPTGANDDQVDMLSQGVNWLEANKPPTPYKEIRAVW